MKADFRKDLAKGHSGEIAFLERCNHQLKRTDGRKGDFELDNGDILELKADSYDHALTPNLFLELISYGDKVGGPAQAKAHGCKYFAYFFVNSGHLYLFKTNQLVAWLDKHQHKYGRVFIKNKGYTTQGIKVRKIDVMHLCIKPIEIGLKYKYPKKGVK